MRKVLAVLAVSLFAVLVVPGMALATHSNGQGPAQDFISGAAKGPVPVPPPNNFAPGHFHTNAQAQDNLTNVATGQFWTVLTLSPPLFGYSQAEFSGDVNCLNATIPDGLNSANWSATITDVLLSGPNVPDNPAGIPNVLAPGMGVISRHIDESPPTEADRALGFTQSHPLTCMHPLLFAAFQTIPITQGNLIVHEGS
jgi:hypothetical protein